MLAEERRIQLAEWSRVEGRIDAISAAERLDVAVETVRRDLEVLQRRGVVRRVHGGAISTERLAREFDFNERKQSNPGPKKEIAKVAAKFIPAAGCVFVDGGSTTEYLAEALKNKPDLLVVTASLTLAAQIARTGTPVRSPTDGKVNVMLPAGTVEPNIIFACTSNESPTLLHLKLEVAFPNWLVVGV